MNSRFVSSCLVISDLGISSKVFKIVNNSHNSFSVIVGMFSIDPAIIVQDLPLGWALPPEGAQMLKPPAPRVSIRQPPSSPALEASLVFPSIGAPSILTRKWIPPDGVISE